MTFSVELNKKLWKWYFLRNVGTCFPFRKIEEAFCSIWGDKRLLYLLCFQVTPILMAILAFSVESPKISPVCKSLLGEALTFQPPHKTCEGGVTKTTIDELLAAVGEKIDDFWLHSTKIISPVRGYCLKNCKEYSFFWWLFKLDNFCDPNDKSCRCQEPWIKRRKNAIFMNAAAIFTI